MCMNRLNSCLMYFVDIASLRNVTHPGWLGGTHDMEGRAFLLASLYRPKKCLLLGLFRPGISQRFVLVFKLLSLPYICKDSHSDFSIHFMCEQISIRSVVFLPKSWLTCTYFSSGKVVDLTLLPQTILFHSFIVFSVSIPSHTFLPTRIHASIWLTTSNRKKAYIYISEALSFRFVMPNSIQYTTI